MPYVRPATHGQILRALSRNAKLPDGDQARVAEALVRYDEWRAALDSAQGEGEQLLDTLVAATNAYKRFIEFDLVFLSGHDFLYRQSGQLKLNNTILEEFLPFLVDERLVPGLRNISDVTVGPQPCYAGMFIGPVHAPLHDGGIYIKTKNQDFTVGRKLHLRACFQNDYQECLDTSFNVAYFVSELKTNLDKTMFQEAAATARELKGSVGDSVYVLICEWLDMPPIDTRVTEIDEVIILRKARRLGSQVRSSFSSVAGRMAARNKYEAHLDKNPLSVSAFSRVVDKLKVSFPEIVALNETAVLERGYF
jgi:hypothetical protein